MAPAEDDRRELTIDALAQEAGMTVRNVRAHQSRGLLQPPEIRGRVGFYGSEHVKRLQLIRDMQAEGLNLRAIERMLGANGAGEQALDLGRQLLGAFIEEEPEFATAEELRRRLGVEPDDERLVAKATKLRIIRPLGDDRFEIPSPTLLRAGEELVALGIPAAHALEVAETIERHSRAIAERFVRLFEELIGSRDPREQTPEDWERLRHALDRLRPLATEAVRAGFAQTMNRTVERRLEKLLWR